MYVCVCVLVYVCVFTKECWYNVTDMEYKVFAVYSTLCLIIKFLFKSLNKNNINLNFKKLKYFKILSVCLNICIIIYYMHKS